MLSFENEDDRIFFSWNKRLQRVDQRWKFFDSPIEGKEETYENIIEMGRNNDSTTGNLLDYGFFFKALQTGCNRSEQPDWITESFKTAD